MSPYSDPAVAAAYDRVAVPSNFAAPARDLVAALNVRQARPVVDVGTGTGAVAAAVRLSTTSACRIVIVDASAAMLPLARQPTQASAVIGRLPHLPFSADAFDAVAASFVISHVPDYAGALAEMVRICRRQGRVGITAWAGGSVPIGDLWCEIAGRYVSLDALARTFRTVVPWEEWFSNPDHLRDALQDAQLDSVAVDRRVYTIRMSIDDYLSMKESNVEGSLLRELLGEERWRRFAENAARVCHDRFGKIVEYPRGVYFGIGTKTSE